MRFNNVVKITGLAAAGMLALSACGPAASSPTAGWLRIVVLVVVRFAFSVVVVLCFFCCLRRHFLGRL